MESKIQVLSTTDYSIFSDHTSNREVDLNHVKHLVSAIRLSNLLHINPIVVDKHLKVIDGQHRLEAARQLEVPIYYVQDEKISKKDIASLNTNQKNWTPIDYINFWAVEGLQAYHILSQFLVKFPFFSVSTALVLVGPNDRAAYKRGKLSIDNIEDAEAVGQIVSWFHESYDFASQRNFGQAIFQMYKSGDYDHDRMMKKVSQQPRSLVPCVNKKQYLEMLEEIYNYQMQNKVRF